MQMKRAGEKRVAALNSMSSFDERKYISNHLSDYQFLFVSPEMLQSDWLIAKLKQLRIGLLVVDEAHCISQWGMDFRPDYLTLGTVRQQLDFPLTLALTATAPEKVVTDVIHFLGLPDSQTDIFFHDPNRKNLFYQVKEVSRSDKDPILLALLEEYPMPGIIYFSSKVQAEAVRQLIKGHTSLKVDTYHADRTLEDRNTIQHQFLEGELDLICATAAFGMGINKSNIRSVIHYHLPNSLEEYLQEAGRAGRDGKESVVTLLYAPSDFQFKMRKTKETDLLSLPFHRLQQDKDLHQHLSDSDHAMLQLILQKKLNEQEASILVKNRIQDKVEQLRKMKEFSETTFCKRKFISNHFGHQLLEKPEWCCSSCQSNVEDFIGSLESIKEEQTKENSQSTEWKEKLIYLFSL
ncbi:RecQ family ATP-dependent DNA helicase [Jeotgalibaca sp. MA1X17-3]|uniref:RecQ family ATP-dependent DNA helicase n=1 Tax=Jeotgalibaca sp. MA1X17-3 TaxID=2908211 RepID=UPI001F3E4732|nr:RecQ family ATP-dependent DNA helicase [Jeotgalibaca sp. MA1X17-3]UJF14842.1 RecQ family ATP-dependent DNA helicase [Jeotgalibaca sp. MA1X17-3]